MAWYDFITGVNPVGAISKEVVTGALSKVGDAADAIYGYATGHLPPDKQAELDLKYAEFKREMNKGQADITLADAQSGSNFRGGWRPAIGWTCAMALWFYYIPPIAMATFLWTIQCSAAMWDAANVATLVLPKFPMTFDIQDILGLVATLLGVATLRTIDKSKGNG